MDDQANAVSAMRPQGTASRMAGDCLYDFIQRRLVPLGVFTAVAASRLGFLGVRAAGPYIALFGGLTTQLKLPKLALS
jgi:hypothetical protein